MNDRRVAQSGSWRRSWSTSGPEAGAPSTPRTSISTGCALRTDSPRSMPLSLTHEEAWSTARPTMGDAFPLPYIAVSTQAAAASPNSVATSSAPRCLR